MKISSLFIYPIKSLQGIKVQEALALERGFEYDRRWMIIDSKNQLITQRTHPQLHAIQLEMEEEKIKLSHVQQGTLKLPLVIDQGEWTHATVWNDEVRALTAHDEANNWISSIVGTDCRLVFMPENGVRRVNPKRALHGENVSFADAYPYLIVSEESLADLNGRLDEPVPMHRFRPNIVVEGGINAFDEDHWENFVLGDLPFYGTHGCKRCVFTTIDQSTGKKGTEPLKTLASYRKVGNEILFGLNALCKDQGSLQVGDFVSIETTRK